MSFSYKDYFIVLQYFITKWLGGGPLVQCLKKGVGRHFLAATDVAATWFTT